MVSAQGSFAGTIQDLVSSARRALFGLKSIFNKNPELIPSLQIEMFNTLVSPILNYGSEVWGLAKADPIEKFHLSFLKNLLCVKQSTPNCFVYGELGVFPLILQRQTRVIKFWLKLLNPTSSVFLRSVYTELVTVNIESPQKVTWVSLLKNTLYKIGLGYYWERQDFIDGDTFINVFEQRIKDIYLQDWHSEVMNTSSNRIFKHLKCNFGLETYLNMHNKAFRVAITKIRLSSHVFMIERARWKVKVPEVNERLCTCCKKIETEYHCLIECPRFTNERMGLVPDFLLKQPNVYNFYNFINCRDEHLLKQLGLLCLKIQKAYKETLVVQ